MSPLEHELMTDNWTKRTTVRWLETQPSTLVYRGKTFTFPSRGVNDEDHSVWMLVLRMSLSPWLDIIPGIISIVFDYFDD